MYANNFLFKANQRKTSTLDKAYLKHLNNIYNTSDEEQQERWETYNFITQELVKDGKEDYFMELKYRVTDGENPNDIILDIIERNIDDINNVIWFLKKKIEEYKEEDLIKNFYD